MAMQQTALPIRGEYIRNPKTQRLVKIGGRTHRNLVRDGYLPSVYRDEGRVYDIHPNETPEEAKVRLIGRMPKGCEPAVGRGYYAGKIVAKHIPLYKAIIGKIKRNELGHESIELINYHQMNGTLNEFLGELSGQAGGGTGQQQYEEESSSDEEEEVVEPETEEEPETEVETDTDMDYLTAGECDDQDSEYSDDTDSDEEEYEEETETDSEVYEANGYRFVRD